MKIVKETRIIKFFTDNEYKIKLEDLYEIVEDLLFSTESIRITHPRITEYLLNKDYIKVGYFKEHLVLDDKGLTELYNFLEEEKFKIE